jgi:GNAT superfamily N-acetyltransferase
MVLDCRVSWILLHQNQVVGQLETYSRPVFLVDVDSDGNLTERNLLGLDIASVFVPKEYRGRGYGKRMVQMLRKHIADTACSVG